MSLPLSISTERRLTMFRLSEAIKETRDEKTGITIHDIAQVLTETMDGSEVAALMDVLSNHLYE